MMSTKPGKTQSCITKACLFLPQNVQCANWYDHSICHEYASLMQKIVRSPHFDENLSISQQIDVCLAKLEDARHHFKRANINKWRDRMRWSASRCYKWLKSMTFVPFRGLVSSSIDLFEPTNTVNASLTLIRDLTGDAFGVARTPGIQITLLPSMLRSTNGISFMR